MKRAKVINSIVSETGII